MKNPLLKMREERNLTISQLALISNMSVITVQRVENGSSKKLPKGLMEVIQRFGYDCNQFRIDYEVWRELKTKEIIENQGEQI